MAAIASTRILALQATSPRVLPIPIVLTADTTVTGIGTLGSINSTATTANSTANTANATANSALALANAGYGDITANILGNSGTAITMTSSSLFRSGSGQAGVFIGAGGLVGKNSSGATTFAVDGATGAATFSGALSAATGTFSGALSAGGVVDITGYVRVTGSAEASGLYASVIGMPSNTANLGVLGVSDSNTGVHGLSGSGTGVKGVSNNYGVHGVSYYGVGVRAESGGGVALQCLGAMTKLGTEHIPNLNADMLDSYHADSFFRYTTYGFGAPVTNAYITVNVGGITVRVPVAYP